jgi:hypothetical protein
MMNHEKVMSLRETARLAELEKTIARGKKTFVEVGLALAEIRDLRLYKRVFQVSIERDVENGVFL